MLQWATIPIFMTWWRRLLISPIVATYFVHLLTCVCVCLCVYCAYVCVFFNVCRCCGCHLRTGSWSRLWTHSCNRHLEKRPLSRNWQTATSPDWTFTTAPCHSSRSGTHTHTHLHNHLVKTILCSCMQFLVNTFFYFKDYYYWQILT